MPLVSTDRREPFLLDLRRARIDLSKDTYQNRRPTSGDPGAARFRLHAASLVGQIDSPISSARADTCAPQKSLSSVNCAF